MRLLLLILLSVFAPVATSSEPIFRYLMVGVRRVPFETEKGGVPFSSVAKILGDLPPVDADAPDTPTSCYRLSGPVPRFALVFFGSDMGGDALTGFEVMPTSSYPALTAKCVWLNVPDTQVVTDRGVRLGLSRVEVETKFGKGERMSDGRISYETTEVRSFKAKDGSVTRSRINSAITVTYRNGRVVAFGGGIRDENDED